LAKNVNILMPAPFRSSHDGYLRNYAGSCTDIVMSGYDLARWIMAQRPQLKILLTSGFPAELNGDNTPELQALTLLRKPHSLADLASAIRAQLDRP
jgi:DNA-binding NarL/FixJ family response regulator